MPWLTKLRVGIDCVCKFVQCLSPWWIVNQKYIMVILYDTQYYKKSKFGNILIINIRMYVIIIFIYKPYLPEDVILVSHKSWSLRRNKCENVHYWKK